MNPVLNYTPIDKQPVLRSVTEKKWTFSFRYWEQIKYFGLDKSNAGWFVSLIEKLKILSEKEVKEFVSNGSERDTWRYHNIDWNQKNIPVQRKDLSWIDKDYLDNEVEFPIVQFQISTALGRVVGFWDENSIFNIVLLDPLHNIQPARSHNYRVDHSNPMSCDYTSLLYDIDQVKRLPHCQNQECAYRAKLEKIPSKTNYVNVLMHYIDDSTSSEVKQLIDSGKASNETEIFQFGIMTLSEESDNNKAG
ncbi:MAG: hypothetical protein Q8R54_05075 [Methylobacter sp.]|nr:hypothetical protein [Methylobacter sp.]